MTVDPAMVKYSTLFDAERRAHWHAPLRNFCKCVHARIRVGVDDSRPGDGQNFDESDALLLC